MTRKAIVTAEAPAAELFEIYLVWSDRTLRV